MSSGAILQREPAAQGAVLAASGAVSCLCVTTGRVDMIFGLQYSTAQ